MNHLIIVNAQGEITDTIDVTNGAKVFVGPEESYKVVDDLGNEVEFESTWEDGELVINVDGNVLRVKGLPEPQGQIAVEEEEAPATEESEGTGAPETGPVEDKPVTSEESQTDEVDISFGEGTGESGSGVENLVAATGGSSGEGGSLLRLSDIQLTSFGSSSSIGGFTPQPHLGSGGTPPTQPIERDTPAGKSAARAEEEAEIPRPTLLGLIGGAGDPDASNLKFAPGTKTSEVLIRSLGTGDEGKAGQSVFGTKGELVIDKGGRFTYYTDLGSGSGRDIYLVDYPKLNDDGSVEVVTETVIFEWKSGKAKWTAPDLSNPEGLNFFDDPDNKLPDLAADPDLSDEVESAILVKSIDNVEILEGENPIGGIGDPVDGEHGFIVVSGNGAYDYVMDPKNPLGENETETFTLTYIDQDGKETVETLTIVGKMVAAVDKDGVEIPGAEPVLALEVIDPVSYEVGEPEDPDASDPSIDPEAVQTEILVESLNTNDTGTGGELVDGELGRLIFNEDGSFDYLPDPTAEGPGIDTFLVTYPTIDPVSGESINVVETFVFKTDEDGNVTPLKPAVSNEPGETFFSDPDNKTPDLSKGIVVESVDNEGGEGSVGTTGIPVIGENGMLIFNENGSFDYLVDSENPLPDGETETFLIKYTDENGETTTESLVFIGKIVPVLDVDGFAIPGEFVLGHCVFDPTSLEVSGPADPDPTDPQVDPAAVPGDIIVTSLDTSDSGNAGEIVDGPRGDLIFNEDGTFDYMPEPGAEPGIDTFTVKYPPVDGGDPVVETLRFETKDGGEVVVLAPTETIDGSFYDDPDNNVPDPSSSIIVKSLESADEAPAGTPVNSSNGILVFNTDGSYDYLANPDSPLDKDELDTFTITYTDEAGKVTVETLTFIGDGLGGAETHEPYSVEVGGLEDPDPTDPKVAPGANAGDIIVTSLDTSDSGPAGELVDGPRGDLMFNEDGTFDYIPQPGATPGIDTFTVEYPPVGGGVPVVETLQFETRADGTVQLIAPAETINGSFYDDPDNNAPEATSSIIVKSIDTGNEDDAGKPVRSSSGTLVFNTDGSYDYLANPDSPLDEDELDTFTITYTDDAGNVTVETLTFIGDGLGGADTHEPYSVEIGGVDDPDTTNPKVAPGIAPGEIKVISLDTNDMGEAGELVDGPRGDLIVNVDGTFDYIPQPNATPGIDTFTVEYPPVDGGDPVVETLTFETFPDGTVSLVVPDETINGSFYDDPDNNAPDLTSSIVVKSIESSDEDDAGNPVVSSNGTLVFNTDGTYDYLANPDSPLGKDELDVFTITYTDTAGKVTVESLTFVGDGAGSADVHEPLSLEIGSPADPDNTDPKVDPAATAADIIVTSLDTGDSGNAGDLVDGELGILIFNEDGTYDFVPDPKSAPGQDIFTVTYPPAGGGLPVTETLIFEKAADGTVSQVVPDETINGSFYDDSDNHVPDPTSSIIVRSIESSDEDNAGNPVVSSNGTLVFNTDGTYDYIVNPDSPLDQNELDVFTVTYTDPNGKGTVETLTFIGDGAGSADVHEPYSVQIGGTGDPDETNPKVDPTATAGKIVVTSLDTSDTGNAGEIVDGPRGDLIVNEDGTFDYIPEPNASPGLDTFTVSYPPVGDGNPVTETLTFETFPDGTVQLVSPDETINGNFYEDPDNNTPDPSSSIIVKSIGSNDEDDAGNPVVSSNGTLVFNTDGTFDYVANPDSSLDKDELDVFTVTYTDTNGEVTVETLTFVGDGSGSADVQEPLSNEIGGSGDPDNTDLKVAPSATSADIIVTSLDTGDTGPAGDLVEGEIGDLIFNEDGTYDFIPDPNSEPGQDIFTVTYPPVGGGTPVTETLIFEKAPDGTVTQVVPDETIDGNFFEDPDNNRPDPTSSIIVKSLDSNDEDNAGKPVKSGNGTLIFNTDGTYDYVADPDAPLSKDELDVFTVTYTDTNGKVTVETLTFVGDGAGSADLQDPFSAEIGGLDDPDATDPKVDPTATKGLITVTSLDTTDSGNAGDLVDGPRGDLIFNEDGTFDYIRQPGSPVGIDTFTVTYPPIGGGSPVTETLQFETLGDGTVQLVVPDETIDGNFFADPDNENPNPVGSIIVASVESGDDAAAGNPVVSAHGTLVFNQDGTYDYLVNPDNPMGENEEDTFTVTYTDPQGNKTVETLNFVGDLAGSADVQAPVSDDITTADNSENPAIEPGTQPAEIIVTSLNTGDTGPGGDLVDGGLGDLVFNPDGTFDYNPTPGAPAGIDVFTVKYPDENGNLIVETLTFQNDGSGNVEIVNPTSGQIGNSGDPDVTNNLVPANTLASSVIVSHPETGGGDETTAGNPLNGNFGTIVVNFDGTFDYVPQPDSPAGSEDTFLVTYPHPSLRNETVTETLTFVHDGNGNAPAVEPDSTGDLDQPGESPNISALGPIVIESLETGDSDIPGSEVQGEHSNIVFNIDGTFDINVQPDATPNPGETEVFQVKYFDKNFAPQTQDLVVQYNGNGGANVLPFGADAANFAREDGSEISGDLVAYDVDSTEPVVISFDGVETYGNLIVNTQNGNYFYGVDNNLDVVQQLSAGQTVVENYTYTVEDEKGGTVTHKLSITIEGVNDAPTGIDDVVNINEDTVGSDTGTDVAGTNNGLLANDSDVDTLDVHRISKIRVGSSNKTVPDGGETTVTLGNGSLTIGSDGSYSFDPGTGYQNLNVGESAVETFQYTIEDDHGGTNVAQVTISISGANDGPAIVANTLTLSEGELITVDNTMINSTDVDDGPTDLSYTVSNLVGGEFLVNGIAANTFTQQDIADGLVKFQHDGEELPPAYQLTVTDSGGLTDQKSLTANYTPVNDAPVANDDANSVIEDGQQQVSLVPTNDTDAENNQLSITNINSSFAGVGIPVTLVSGATVMSLGNGEVIYNTNGKFESLLDGETAIDTFTYRISDGNGGVDTASVTMTITGVNDAPVITKNTVTLAEGETIPITTANINATDSDHGPTDLVFTVTNISGGTFLLDGNATNTFTQQDINDGKVEFEHDGGEVKPDWDLKVTDPGSLSDTDSPTVTYTAVNDVPDAVDDAVTISESQIQSIPVIPANDTDAEGDPLSIIAVNGGAVNAGFPFLLGSGARVTVLGSDIKYEPNGAFEHLGTGETAIDSFTYTINDGNGGRDTATVTVNITGLNDAPIANDESAITNEDTPIIGLDILVNDTDAEDSTPMIQKIGATSVVVDSPILLASGATVTYRSNGKFDYDPNGKFESLGKNETATDSFVYTVVDSEGITDTATATITINGINDNPDAVDDASSTSENTIKNIKVLTNDTDVEAQLLTINQIDGQVTAAGVPITLASGALATLKPDGSIDYNPNGKFESLAVGQSTTDTFTYTIKDDDGGTDTATVTVTITGQNDAPTAVDDTFQVHEHGTAVFDLRTADTDPDGDTLTVIKIQGTTLSAGQSTTLASGAIVTLNNAGEVTYNPNDRFELALGDSTTDSFTYEISDGNNGFDTATATVTILGDNDAPVAVNDFSLGNTPGRAVTFDVTANDYDIDGTIDPTTVDLDPSTPGITQTRAVAGEGVWTTDGTGIITFTPDPNLVGQPSALQYTVLDNNGASTGATGNITVTYANFDIWFGNDLSGSVDSSEFAQSRVLVSGFSDMMYFNETNGTKAALYSWGSTGQQINNISLTADDDAFVAQTAVYGRNFSGGTDIADSIRFGTQQILSSLNAGGLGRTNSDQILVILTDASPGSQVVAVRSQIISAANAAKAAGVTVAFIAIQEAQSTADSRQVFLDAASKDAAGNPIVAFAATYAGINQDTIIDIIAAVAPEHANNLRNEPIYGVGDAAIIAENGTALISALANDDHVSNDTLTITQIEGNNVSENQTILLTSGSSVTLRAGGVLEFDPGQHYGVLNTGEADFERFDYTVEDQSGNSKTVFVGVTVEGVTGLPPVVIDLDGDGVEFNNIENGIAFDVDGDGIAEQTAWANEDDAVLVYDKNDNGNVDELSEVSFRNYSEGAETDLEGLLYFDTDGDHRLSANDAEFSKFKLWQDADGDGLVGDGEMMTLEEAGIESIDLISDGITYSTNNNDVLVHGETTVNYTDGSTGIAADAEFNYEEMLTSNDEDSLTAVTSDGQAIEIESAGDVAAAAVPAAPEGDLIEAGAIAQSIEEEAAVAVAAA